MLQKKHNYSDSKNLWFLENSGQWEEAKHRGFLGGETILYDTLMINT